MPRFCRHSRFIERCPICRETVPGLEPVKRSSGSRRASAGAGSGATRTHKRAGSGRGVRVYTDGSLRGQDDGYSCELVPGLHNSSDAQRLAEELAFVAGRLNLLSSAPPSLYGEVRQQESWERATWMCFLIAYLSPLQGEDPFVGIRRALGAEAEASAGTEGDGDADAEAGGGEARAGVVDWRVTELPDLDVIPLGPRTSHEYARGNRTLEAYLHWTQRAGSQVRAFSGDHNWSEARRFERLFERLALPGLGRMGRYDLLVTLGRLGLYELEPDSLHLGGGRMQATGDLTTLAAKRLFAIGDPLILERRSLALAEAASVPVEALDLGLANWHAGERATLGVPSDTSDDHVLEHAQGALEL
jgi:Alpha-glutamyl/putrescinyl thymine pyrophosphorylase clade 3